MNKIEKIIETVGEIQRFKEDSLIKKKILAKRFEKEILIISIGKNYFAFKIEYLKEICEINNNIITIPFVPSYILGIIHFRGAIISILSLLKILGLKDNNKYYKILVLEDKFLIGVPFNEIVDLIGINMKAIKKLKRDDSNKNINFLSEGFKYKGKIAYIIDIPKIYSSRFLK
jgi:purine-binding chemotaxis protein CheW